MKTLKELGQHALWSITGLLGARYVREARADVATLSRARQCKAFGVSVFATDDELEQARQVWLAALPTIAMMMDETGASTADAAVATWQQWKQRADEVDRMQAEIAEIKAEIAANKEKKNADSGK